MSCRIFLCLTIHALTRSAAPLLGAPAYDNSINEKVEKKNDVSKLVVGWRAEEELIIFWGGRVKRFHMLREKYGIIF